MLYSIEWRLIVYKINEKFLISHFNIRILRSLLQFACFTKISAVIRGLIKVLFQLSNILTLPIDEKKITQRKVRYLLLFYFISAFFFFKKHGKLPLKISHTIVIVLVILLSHPSLCLKIWVTFFGGSYVRVFSRERRYFNDTKMFHSCFNKLFSTRSKKTKASQFRYNKTNRMYLCDKRE